MSVRQLLLTRAAGQHLLKTTGPGRLAGVVRSMVGVNAQRSSAMMLSLRARIPGLSQADVEKAVEDERTLARAWAMRGTLHLVDAEDLRWLVALLGEVVMAKTARRRSELGLDDELLSVALKEMKKVMRRSGPLTRWELMDALEAGGMTLDRKSQAPIHLVQYAALSGLVCLGPERDNGEATYVLLDAWIAKGGKERREISLAALIERYLQGFGPAASGDFSAWSGMPLKQTRDTWRSLTEKGKLREVRVEGRSLWMNEEDKRHGMKTKGHRPLMRLLPAFDSYVLAYSDRALLMPEEARKHIYHGGQTLPTMVVDGAVAGAWRYERKGKRLGVELSPFEPLDDALRAQAVDEARDIGRFLGLSAFIKG